MRLIRLDKAEPGGSLGNFNDHLKWFFGPMRTGSFRSVIEEL